MVIALTFPNFLKLANISAGTFSLKAPTWILNLTISESIGFSDGVEETSRFSEKFFLTSKPASFKEILLPFWKATINASLYPVRVISTL